MASGTRMGIDWGKARIGVAACTAGTSLAYPVTTIAAGRGELGALKALVAAYDPGVVYVGLPLTLQGTRAAAALTIADKAVQLAQEIAPVEVRLVDERMSTVSASRHLRSAGRKAKRQRAVIDQAAAVEILQRALDGEDREGEPVGELI